MKRKFQSTWNCNSLLFNNPVSEGSWVCKANQRMANRRLASRHAEALNPARGGPPLALRLGTGGLGGDGAERRAPPRVPERGWYSVWLGPLQDLGSEPGEYLPARSKLYVPIAIPPSGGPGWKIRLRGGEGARDEQPSRSGKETGPFVSRGWRWRMLGQGLRWRLLVLVNQAGE